MGGTRQGEREEEVGELAQNGKGPNISCQRGRRKEDKSK